jgi:hypothetical protein
LILHRSEYTVVLNALLTDYTSVALAGQNGHAVIAIGSFLTAFLFHIGWIFDGNGGGEEEIVTVETGTTVTIGETALQEGGVGCTFTPPGDGSAERQHRAGLCRVAATTTTSGTTATPPSLRCLGPLYRITVTVLRVDSLPDMDKTWGFGKSDPYVTVFLGSYCNPSDCGSVWMSDACSRSCLKTGAQDNKESATWSGEAKVFEVPTKAQEEVHVKVMDEDEMETDELILSGAIRGWAEGPPQGKDYVLRGSGASTVSVRLSYTCEWQ